MTLNSVRELVRISESIADLAFTLKRNSVDVSMSNIIVRNEKYNEKGTVVNSHLKRLCIEKNIIIVIYYFHFILR